ncbi:DUF383-domain-containing protein [Eremomyces bilateralis CBS 781.70]|uniref:Protein HGH1 homolog n=1 Tax=Eremomyces bilateralis CBS 781.70 TaxID=1392243 RepID=A0A6G1G473_9PEZI|nr:DUF383-domain-containing protein [Eremomyces bilateralis CBS 781.70]KAF1812818.1 DUF383-domain-containing protein [Eremomyces bilateralis CBS 781.70]
MSTELEDLVEFLHHGNTQVRQIAVENLVGFSTAQPDLFRAREHEPIKDLKLLVKDYPPIAKNALTMLINLTEGADILENLSGDNEFIMSLLSRITNPKEESADLIAMLLSNLTKSEKLKGLLDTKVPERKELSRSQNAMDQLMDCFVKGAEGGYNKHANFDYLSYAMADLAQYPEGQQYFTRPRKDDEDIIPVTKLTVFTEHSSVIRRRGVASTIKNLAFAIPTHPQLLSPIPPRLPTPSDFPDEGANLLPYILLPLMGPEEYSDQDTEEMLEDLQLLPPDKRREPEPDIVKTHLETLLLLTTTKDGRETLRRIKTYPIVRECHVHVEDDDVTEACDRLVQVLMRGEEGEAESLPEGPGPGARGLLTTPSQSQIKEVEEEEDDEDDQIIEVL